MNDDTWIEQERIKKGQAKQKSEGKIQSISQR